MAGRVKGSGGARSRSGDGGGLEVGGPGVVLEVAADEIDELGAGNGSRGAVLGGFSCFQVRPRSGGPPVRAVPLAAFIPSRVPGRGRGAWGGSASEEAGQAGSIRGTPPPPGRRGRIAGDLAPGRWPGKAVHAASAVWVTGGFSGVLDRQRICPSRIP